MGVTGDSRSLRLLLIAAACWCGAGVTRLVDASPVVVPHRAVAFASATLLLAVLLALALAAARHVDLPWTAALAAMALLAGVLAASMAVAASTAEPLGGWIERRVTVEMDGVVGSEGRAIRSAFTGESSQEVRLATGEVRARGVAVAVEVPLTLRISDGLDVPPPGAYVQVLGRLAPARPLGEAMAVVQVRELQTLAPPGPVEHAAHAMRVGLRAATASSAPDAAALVAGLSVGDESQQTPQLADAMRASGLSHLTAVSGGNVAIVLAVLLGACAILRVNLGARVLCALGGLAFFTILVGPQPSVLRAVAMGVIATVGLVVGGARAGASTLAIGVIALVITSPWLSTSWGFALSAVATGGLILLVAPVTTRLQRWPFTRDLPGGVREAAAVTIAAQLATLPVLVAMGGAVGWVAVPANLLAMPAVPPVTILGLLAALLSPLVPWLAHLLAWLAAWPAGWIALVARVASELPGAGVPWVSGWPGALAIVLIAVGVFAVRRLSAGRITLPGAVRPMIAAIVAATLVLAVIRPPSRHGWPPAGWLMIMCDVGQGDALLLRAAPSSAVVVDVGPDPVLIDRCLDDVGIDTVPALLLTHFHADHVGGLAGVFRGRSVGAVLVNPVQEPPAEAASVTRTLAALGRVPEAISAGDARVIGAVSWQSVWPRRRIAAGSVPNNASIVLEAAVAGHRILLTGDVEVEAQTAVAADVRGRTYDVVKVPHHGSRNQAAGLTSWAPAPIALISVGVDNDYGHPAPQTVAAWEGIGALVARTDLDGDIAVVDNGGVLGIVTRTE